MYLKPSSRLMIMLMWMVETTEARKSYSVSLQNVANVSYATKNLSPSASGSMFSPRMNFDQWKPLIGRGDPLRNDPTYDYEPPVLERVRYWADESRIEREHYPERKSEVLMLGITSRKPSVSPQQPLLPLPQRRQRLPPPPNYEDLTYKISEYYPMTILVPPPPSPPGHKPSLFILSEEKTPLPYAHGKKSVPTKLYPKTTTLPPHHSSSYDIKEANLIYQSSTTIENWATDPKQTNSVANSAVSSEYAGWGPTTPIDEIDTANDTLNSIFYDYKDLSKHPYSFYKPMPSESPSPVTSKPFLPTILPTFSSSAYTTPLTTQQDIADIMKTTTSSETPSTELPTTYFNDVIIAAEQYEIQVDQSSNLPTLNNTEHTVEDMMGPMMSMPLGNGPERPQDNLYAHATNNLHVFKEYQSEDTIELENMQTMQPPPANSTERTPISHDQYDLPPHILSTLLHNSPVAHALDPYLHMRFTTPTFDTKSTTEAPVIPMYLIIQGHSKVKTYGSKPQTVEDNERMSSETQKLNITDEVKHLHPINDKKTKKLDNSEMKRKSRTHNLISLVDSGLGSVEIQEADVGIKYDISDGSKVPVEIYRKGIVDSEIINNYLLKKKQLAKERKKRQISIEDLIPFDEDTLEEYVYNFLEERRNDTGITGIIAQAVTSDAAAAVDELENDDDDER